MSQSPTQLAPQVAFSVWRDREIPASIRGISSDHVLENDGLTVAVVRLAPGALVPLHRHEHSDEIFDVLYGKGEILINDQWVPLESGCTALVEAGALHALRNPGSETLVLRETVRDRVYARAAVLTAFKKRWRKLKQRK